MYPKICIVFHSITEKSRNPDHLINRICVLPQSLEYIFHLLSEMANERSLGTVKPIMDYVLKSICANNIFRVNIAGALSGSGGSLSLVISGRDWHWSWVVCVCRSSSSFRMQAVGAARTRNGRGQVAAGCLARKGDNAKNCAIDWGAIIESGSQEKTWGLGTGIGTVCVEPGHMLNQRRNQEWAPACVCVCVYPDCFLSITSPRPQFIIDSRSAHIASLSVSTVHRCRSSQAKPVLGISMEILGNFGQGIPSPPPTASSPICIP